MSDVLIDLMRWLHISSMATLVGGFLYLRFAMTPASSALAPDARETLAQKTAAAFRPFGIAAIFGLLISGGYTLLSSPGHSPRYHALLGVKLLLALHIFAAVLLLTRQGHPRQARIAAGALVSGLMVVLISAYLRRIF